jgi:tRNA(fMet)-specific endonuclease VapC
VTALDTDVWSDLVNRVPQVVVRTAVIPADRQVVPVVVAEEALRGQLAGVRAAQAHAKPAVLVRAYAFLHETLDLLREVRVLPYTTEADDLFRQWRSQGIRIGTRDLRIAAVAVAHGATLVTRTARDFRLVPGLSLDVWS